MKLAMCNKHDGMNRELPCLAIRHDDGRKATPQEVWDWAMSLDRKAREECCQIADRVLVKYENRMAAAITANEIVEAIRATIQE